MSINPSNASARRTVVIGLGNPIMGDDGVGLAALARLRDAWQVPRDVELVDGGTWGMRLLPTIEDADGVLLIDAIDVGAAAGTLVVLERDELPRFLASKLSTHQVDMGDVLAVAHLRGALPERLTAVGLQPARVEMCAELTDCVRHRVEDLAARAVDVLRSWGHDCARSAMDR